MKRGAAALAGLALAMVARSAAAETRTFGTARVDVTMPRDPSCPSDREVLDGLGAALGPMPEAESQAAFRVLVETSPRGTVGTVEGRGETRRVAGATCHEVAEAIALVLVLSIEAHANTNVELPVVAPPPAPPAPAPEAPPPRPPPRAIPITFGAAASVGILSGLLPSAAGLGTVAVVVRHARIPLEARIGIGGFLPARLHVARGELDFQAFRAFASTCGATSNRLSFGLCTGLGVDTVLTTSSNYLETPDTAVAIASLTLGPSVRYRVGKRWSVGVDAEAGVVLTPTRWHVPPAGEVHRTSAIEGRVGFFGEMHFW